MISVKWKVMDIPNRNIIQLFVERGWVMGGVYFLQGEDSYLRPADGAGREDHRVLAVRLPPLASPVARSADQPHLRLQ